MKKQRGNHTKQSKKMKSIQNLLINDTINEGFIVSKSGAHTLFFKMIPLNINLMSHHEKESAIDEMRQVIETVSANEIHMLVDDSKIDISTNIALYEKAKKEAKNTYIEQIVTEELADIVSRSENGNDRNHFLALTYYDISLEVLKTEIAKVETLNTRYQQHLATKNEIQKLYQSYYMRDFTDVVESDLEYAQLDPDIKVTDTNKGHVITEFRDFITPSVLRFLPTYIETSDEYKHVIVVRKWPSKMAKQMCVSELAKLKNTTLKFTATPIQLAELEDGMNKTINSNQHNSHSSKATDVMTAQKENSDLSFAYVQILENNEKFYDFSMMITCRGKTKEELEKTVIKVEHLLSAVQIRTDRMKYQQKEAYISATPNNANRIHRKISRNLPASTVANFLPYTFSGRQDPSGVYLGKDQGGGDFFLDVYDRAADTANDSIVIQGDSGEGKSFLIKKLIVRMYMLTGSVQMGLDPDGEYKELVEFLQGAYVVPGGKYRINPLEVRYYGEAEEEDKNDEPEAFHTQSGLMAQHIGNTRMFFKTYRSFTREELDVLESILDKLYVQFNVNEQTVPTLKSSDYPIMGDLYELLETCFYEYDQDVQKHLENFAYPEPKYTKEQIRTLMNGIAPIAIGSQSIYFNGHTYMPENVRIIMWDMQKVLTAGEEVKNAMQFSIMSYVWNYIVEHRYDDVKMRFIIDELSLMLTADNFQMLLDLVSMEKRIRKYNGGTLKGTQHMIDFLRPKIRQYTLPLFATPSYKINFYPGKVDTEEFKQFMQISDTEFDIIRQPNKGNCLITAGSKKYNVKIAPATPTEQFIFGKGGGA